MLRYFASTPEERKFVVIFFHELEGNSKSTNPIYQVSLKDMETSASLGTSFS